ncbi:MAG TPA: enolase C-terminal domain-like protein, partial [Myxococcota bacterium]
PVARAGTAGAIADAWARSEGRALHALLGGSAAPAPLTTDITLPIGAPAYVAELARTYRAAGFSCFKVKIGRDYRADHVVLRAVAASVPDARFRLDANAGFTARDALALLDLLAADALPLECFEQPCARDDDEGNAHVTALAGCPVIADEGCRTVEDVLHLAHKKAATGVNLKLSKHGGLVEAGRVGRAARRAGLKVMVGAMVETRLGLTAMAHVARALGTVDFVDLDTALLLRWDPFAGGYTLKGAVLTLDEGHGLNVTEAAPQA